MNASSASVLRIVAAAGLALAALPACRDEPRWTPVVIEQPVWPPAEGEFCGAARMACAPDGRTLWTCDARPLWRGWSCPEICGDLGREHVGCVVGTLADADWLVVQAGPGLVPALAKPTAACQCGDLEPACRPGQTLCGGMDQMFVCEGGGQWEPFDCEDVCATHGGRSAGCRNEQGGPSCACTRAGTPCPSPEAAVCGTEDANHSEIWRCRDGLWTYEDCAWDLPDCEAECVMLDGPNASCTCD